MKTKSKNRTIVLAIILLGLLVIAYKIMFVSPSQDMAAVDQNIEASQRVEGVLAQVKKINFDTSILDDAKFQSLKSLEIPLISLPVGKKNPFSSNY